MKKWLIWGPLALFLFFLGVAGYQLTQPREEFVRSAMIGEQVPAFELPAYGEGRAEVTQAIFRDGQPKLLNIWASWCAPCIAEAPFLEQLERQGVAIVGVALRDKPEDIARFLQLHGDPFVAIARDDMSELQLSLGSSGVPETFVIDGRGIIRYQHLGPILERDVPVILAELEKAR